MRVCESAFLSGFELMGLANSPIEGGDGNREYLAYFKRSEHPKKTIDIKQVKNLVR